LALAKSGAVLDLSIDGAKATPVVLKEAQRDPVRGETVHIDLLRVRLDQAIHAVVPLELEGTDDAPGVKEGGILEQIIRELNVEALPTAIPESIVYDVGEMQIGDTIGLERRACRPRRTTSKQRPSWSARAAATPRPRATVRTPAETPPTRSSDRCDAHSAAVGRVSATPRTSTAARSTG
jgi:large subunit ribosomal protein L25